MQRGPAMDTWPVAPVTFMWRIAPAHCPCRSSMHAHRQQARTRTNNTTGQGPGSWMIDTC